MSDYYKILGISTEASPEELKTRFTKIIKRTSFFSFGSSRVKKIELIKEAFDNLIDPAARHHHDLSLNLYSTEDTAPWRNLYKNYTNQDLEEDLNFSADLLEELIEDINNSKTRPVIIFTSLGLVLILLVLLVLLASGSGYMKNLSGIEQGLDMNDPKFKIFDEHEQVLFNSLSPNEKQKLMIILNQVMQLDVAPNFPELLNSCKIHLEAVSVPEELIVKYQGLLSCFREAAKI